MKNYKLCLEISVEEVVALEDDRRLMDHHLDPMDHNPSPTASLQGLLINLNLNLPIQHLRL